MPLPLHNSPLSLFLSKWGMDVLILLDGYFNLTPDARIQIKLLMFLDRFHGFLFSVNLTFSEIQS